MRRPQCPNDFRRAERPATSPGVPAHSRDSALAAPHPSSSATAYLFLRAARPGGSVGGGGGGEGGGGYAGLSGVGGCGGASGYAGVGGSFGWLFHMTGSSVEARCMDELYLLSQSGRARDRASADKTT